MGRWKRRRAARALPWAAALAAACMAGAGYPALARPARATFLSLGADGRRQQHTLEDVRYGYFVRTLLDKKPSGKNADPEGGLPRRDRTLRKRYLALQDGKIHFHMIRSIEFAYRASDTPGAHMLVLRVTLETGTELDVPSSELRGFESFKAPFLEGREGAEPRVFELEPFMPEGATRRAPALEKVLFHNRARAPQRRRSGP